MPSHGRLGGSNTFEDPTLSADERALLSHGVSQWGGPAKPTDALAAALGVEDLTALVNLGEQVNRKLLGGETLSDYELVFALVSTELTFISDRWGAGVEWATVTGRTDSETIKLLRQLQVRFVGVGPRPWP